MGIVNGQLFHMKEQIFIVSLLAVPYLVYGPCCPSKRVTGMGNLDDIYTLKDDKGVKPEDVCVDGCVYTRNDPLSPSDEYCFKNGETEGNVECQELGTTGEETEESTITDASSGGF